MAVPASVLASLPSVADKIRIAALPQDLAAAPLSWGVRLGPARERVDVHEPTLLGVQVETFQIWGEIRSPPFSGEASTRRNSATPI